MRTCRDYRIAVLSLVLAGALCLGPTKSEKQDSDLAETAYLVWHDDALRLVGGLPPPRHELPAFLAPFFFEKIAVNQADSRLLATVPGIGPVLARRITVEREEHGSFRAPEELIRVPGIGARRATSFQPYLRFD